MPVGPGVASSEGRGARRGLAARAVVPIVLASAALTGLLAALVRPRRKQPPRPASDPGQPGTEGPEGKTSLEGKASRPDGPTRSGWYGAAALALVAVVCAAVSVFGYNWLSRWYRPVMLTVTTNSQSNG
jgi:hypothetical protein